MPFPNYFRPLYLVLIFLVFTSCKPAITSFTVTPLVITGDQKVKIDLDVKGEPSLEFNEHLSVDSVQLLEFTLIASKAGKEARKTVQVQKLKSLAPVEIAFATSSLDGDMVLATGENNNNQWRNFQVVSVSSPMSRDIMVTHDGRSATLKSDGSVSLDLSGTMAGGQWSFKTRLTPGEKADSTKIPQELRIRAIIKPSNP
jgi:hypothetical protein